LADAPVTLRAVLLDIEGTTTPLDFVTETLFPYARQHGRQFLLSHADEEIQAALQQLRRDNPEDQRDGAPVIEEGSPAAIEATIHYYFWLMDRDRKSTALKTIQGRIWQQGYAQGELQSMVFPDVRPALEWWRAQGRRTAIYSSGSVLAQQQLFRHTIQGDLTPWIDAYFDTRVGPKQGVESYHTIAQALEFSPREVLFVSDVVSELEAAKTAGMRTALSVRSGFSMSGPETVHPVIHSFDELP
jgi:enolase-phosphatase E1